MARPRLTLVQALEGVIEPAGKTIVDVGCGDGALVRHFVRLGAHAIGVEVSEGQLERARAQAENGGTYHGCEWREPAIRGRFGRPPSFT